MKILGIRTDWNQNDYREENDKWGGIGYYRIVKPLEAIGQPHIGKSIKDCKDYAEVVRGYDAILIKPVDNVVGSQLITACLQEGVKFIVDQDDNIFESRKNQDSYEKLKVGSVGRSIVASFCSFADAMICSTVPLMNYYKKHFKEVYNLDIPMFHLPNYNDIEDFNFIPTKKDKLVIGWPGSRSHYDDLRMVAPALIEILEKNPDIELELMGGVEHDKIDLIFKNDSKALDRVFISGGTPAYDDYPKLLASKGWDIGIAPLIDDEFNRGKSHIKWMEFAMYKIPVVASKVYPYYQKIKGQPVIEHGKTGFLAKDKFQWVQFLQKLIDDARLRKEIGENAYQAVKSNWQWNQHKSEIEDIFKKILKLPTKTLKDYIDAV